jgi:hypothetical protein
MKPSKLAARAGVLAAVLFLAACTDMPTTMAPPDDALAARGAAAAVVTEVMGLQGTVFGGRDLDTGTLVFGVENDGAARGVRNALTRLGIPATEYDIQVTDPIHFMSDNLRSVHRPVVAGIQLHWSGYVCTLGFNVDHAGGRSFITNSHCTDKQGTTGNTQYNQPTRTISPAPIAFEADDPPYTKDDCSVGKVCRDSDAARALYEPGVESRARIAKTTGINSGSLTVDGHFTIGSQDNTTKSFDDGTTMQKVGRTTGWTSGDVTDSCVRVNVSGSNIQLRCQTIVRRPGTRIVQGGDSGSPVFTGSNSSVTLRGILWGGNSAGDMFVFSPLQNIQGELGSMNATTDGVGGGGGGDDPPPAEEDEDEPCIPRGPHGNNCK